MAELKAPAPLPVTTFTNAAFVRQTPQEFYTQQLSEADVLMIAEPHDERSFAHLAKMMKAFKEAGAEAVFIERPITSQADLDEAVKASRPDGGGIGIVNYDMLLYPSRVSELPLFAMDSGDAKNHGDLVRGDEEHKKAAFEEYAKKHGREAAQEKYKKELGGRMDANDIWVENIADVVAKKKLKKFVVIGGGTHMNQGNDVDEKLAKKLGLKVAHIVLKPDEMIAIPTITPSESRFGTTRYSATDQGDFVVMLPEMDHSFGLTPADAEALHKKYDVLYEAGKFPDQVEFYKGAHMKVQARLTGDIATMEKMLAGKDEYLQGYEKRFGPLSDEDKGYLKQALADLNDAKKALGADIPDLKTLSEKTKSAQDTLSEKFGGGLKAVSKRQSETPDSSPLSNRLVMLTSSIEKARETSSPMGLGVMALEELKQKAEKERPKAAESPGSPSASAPGVLDLTVLEQGVAKALAHFGMDGSGIQLSGRSVPISAAAKPERSL